MQDVDDNTRIERWRRGDSDALGELVACYRRPLFGYILRMTEGKDEAEDIFQEVWFRAMRGLARYHHHHFLSWLFRITHNLVIDRSRRRKPEISLDENNAEDDQRQFQIAGNGPTPADALEHADLQQRIRAAVDRLPPEQKEVFLMRMEAELPFKEIAVIQGTSINTALARMSYALDKLRTALAEDYAHMQRGTS